MEVWKGVHGGVMGKGECKKVTKVAYSGALKSLVVRVRQW